MRGRASVDIAKRVLGSRGFEVLQEGVRITLQGVEVGEVDLLARSPRGELYAVEVKAGQASPSDVKLLHANALLLNAKPMLVARTLSRESEVLAEKLGVELVELSDLLVLEEEELYATVKAAVEDALLNLLTGFRAIGSVEAMRILEAIAGSSDLREAARVLGLEEGELAKKLSELRRSGLLPPLFGFKQMKLYAEIICTLRKLIK